MAKYNVVVNIGAEIYGTVEADSETEALDKALELIPEECNCYETDVTNCEEEKY